MEMTLWTALAEFSAIMAVCAAAYGLLLLAHGFGF